VGEAETHQRVGGQPAGLHRVVADLAQPERAALEPLQRGVHLVEQVAQLGRRLAPGGGQRRRQPAAAVEELIAERRFDDRGHDAPPAAGATGSAPAARLSRAIWPAW
jgi:hypothetical protein